MPYITGCVVNFNVNCSKLEPSSVTYLLNWYIFVKLLNYKTLNSLFFLFIIQACQNYMNYDVQQQKEKKPSTSNA